MEQLQAVCPPDCKVKILPTNRRGNIKLVVITYPPAKITPQYDLDDWAIEEIHPLHHDKVHPLLEAISYRYRTIYCCGDNFVFYTRFGGVFKQFTGAIHCDAYGDHEYHKYVGKCRKIDELIAYLTTVKNVIF